MSELDPGSFYTHAAVIPEFEQSADSDSDGVTNWDERRRNSDPNDPDVSPHQAQPPAAPTSQDDTSTAATDDEVAQAAEPSEGDLFQTGTSMAAAGTHLASDVLSSDGATTAMTAQATMQLAVDRTELTDPFNEGAAQTTTSADQEALLDDTMPGEGTAADPAPAEETSSYDERFVRRHLVHRRRQ